MQIPGRSGSVKYMLAVRRGVGWNLPHVFIEASHPPTSKLHAARELFLTAYWKKKLVGRKPLTEAYLPAGDGR